MDSAPENIRMVGQRCLAQRHDHVISKQKEALTELRGSVSDLEHMKPPSKSFFTANLYFILVQFLKHQPALEPALLL